MKGLMYNQRKFQDGGGFGAGLGTASSIVSTATNMLSPLLGQIGEKKAKKKRDDAFTSAGAMTDENFETAQKKNNAITQSIMEQTNAIENSNLVNAMDDGGKTKKRTVMKGILYKKAKDGDKVEKTTLAKPKSKKADIEGISTAEEEDKKRKRSGRILGKSGRRYIPGPKGGF